MEEKGEHTGEKEDQPSRAASALPAKLLSPELCLNSQQGQKGDLTPDFWGRKALEQRRHRKRDRKGWKREKELTFSETSPLTYDKW